MLTKLNKKKWVRVAVCSFLAAIVSFCAVLVVSAYFSTRIMVYTDDGNSERFHLGMELNSFFDAINSSSAGEVAANTSLEIACTDTRSYDASTCPEGLVSLGSNLYRKNDASVEESKQLHVVSVTEGGETKYYYAYNENAEYGSASNPYIISKINHLQNLYVLQNCGYFATVTDEGISETDMPYFLVCTSAGAPVSINGTNKVFEYIGNDEYPFIGYLGGAFADGTCNVGPEGSTLSSDQSAIYNLTVFTEEDVVDVGIFGCIGYLGDEGTKDSDGNFEGAVSTVRNILLYDDRVVVEEKSSWDALVDAVAHLFSFSEGENSGIAHENHHIGILAGHVEYGTVEYVSVYYSSDEIAALDVCHTSKSSNGNVSANYRSVSGILGFVHEMNTSQSDGQIHSDGINNDDIAVAGGGVGTGGGLGSGSGRGYVTATEIFNNYQASGQYVEYTVKTTTAGGATESINYTGLLIIATGSYGSATSYSLQDGTNVTISGTVATVSGQGNDDDLSSTWTDFLVRYGTSGNYTYYHRNNKQAETSSVKASGVYLRFASKQDGETWSPLCTQYIRNRLLVGTETTDRFYFYDGVFTFALSSPTDAITPTWDGDTADTFYIGANSDSSWQQNVAEGATAIVSYLRPITSAEEMTVAVNAGKRLVILSKTNGTNYLVTLSETPSLGTWQDGDDICSINAKSVPTLSDSIKESLYTAFSNGTLTVADIPDVTPVDSNNNGKDISDLLSNWDDYYCLYFGGNIANTQSLDEVESTYLVKGHGDGTSASSTTMADGLFPTESVVHSGGTLTEYRDETYDFGGFFFCTCAYTWDGKASRNNQVQTTQTFTFTYYYNNYDGTIINTGKTSVVSRDREKWGGSYWYLEDSFPNNTIPLTSSGTSNGFQMYSTTVSGTTYTGPFVYKFGSSYFSSYSITEAGYGMNSTDSSSIAGSNSVTVNGSVLTLGTVTAYSYTSFFIKTGINYYYFTGGSNTGTKITASVTATSDHDTNGRLIYTTPSGQRGVMAIEVVSSIFSFSNLSNDHYLRIEQRKALLTDYMYTLWCSTDSEHNALSDWTVTYTTSKNGNVTFNGDGSCTIRYDRGESRYLNFNGTKFNGTSDGSASSAIVWLYAYDGSQKASYGRVVYEPTASSGGASYSASDYVLMPDEVYLSTVDSTNGYKPSTTGHTTDPTYTLKSLYELYSMTNGGADSGWKSNSSGVLCFANLQKAFSFGSGTSSMNLVSLFNGNIGTGDGGSDYVRAPIGTTGEESYIPTGCVAFRINTDGENKIRVIVSCPTTDLYEGEEGNPLDYSNDYYFCLWNVSEAGEETLTSINVGNAIQGFELPRSNKYDPASSAGNSEYITVNVDGTDKRCYLNGEEVLIAYEFTVSEEGVYILGSNHTSEIVYFSADSTASTGRDGTASYKIGTVDFVYDNGSKVVTVCDGDPTADGNFDYSNYYYPSLSLLYTDNSSGIQVPLTGDTDVSEVTYSTGDGTANLTFANINNFAIYVKRNQSSSGTDLSWKAKGGTQCTNGIADAAYWQLIRYSYDADTVNRAADSIISRN